MHTVHAELFTPSRLHDVAEGRALIDALEKDVPSWAPHRYGWTEPLRHVYDPDRFDHFWSQLRYDLTWRNAERTANGQVNVRSGPWDILSRIEMYGRWTSQLTGSGLAALMRDCGRSLDITYGMLHPFTAEEYNAYYQGWFELSPEQDRVKSARQGPFPYFLQDLYWGNVFGPPYVELFGADRLRTAPAAAAVELRQDYFYLQLTDDITDVWQEPTKLDAARRTVRDHIGADAFYEKDASTPRRAPYFRTAAEEGLWKPVKGANMTDELRALIAKAPSDEP